MVGKTKEESTLLKAKVKQLCDAGLEAVFLSNQDLLLKEPALVLGKEGTAAYLPDDCQLDARCAVAFLEKVLFFSHTQCFCFSPLFILG